VTNGRDELPLNRLEALSDGVFAIAITLLVLELALEPGAIDDPLPAILDEWPSYLAYVTSFLTIASYLLYLGAIAVGFLLPLVAVFLYLGIALYLGVPAGTIRRLARQG
jgi:hypothetical protein